jgi:hypothetical protein
VNARGRSGRSPLLLGVVVTGLVCCSKTTVIVVPPSSSPTPTVDSVARAAASEIAARIPSRDASLQYQIVGPDDLSPNATARQVAVTPFLGIRVRGGSDVSAGAVTDVIEGVQGEFADEMAAVGLKGLGHFTASVGGTAWYLVNDIRTADIGKAHLVFANNLPWLSVPTERSGTPTVSPTS